MYAYLGGVPTPTHVKYSPLPEVRSEMIKLLKPRPRPPLLPRLAVGRKRRESARDMSHWSLRLKSWSRVLWKERESMWWSWRMAVEVEMESRSASVTVERDSDSGSGHEMVVLWSSDGVPTKF